MDRFIGCHDTSQQPAISISEEVGRRAAVRRHVAGEGSGVLLGWDLGGAPESPREIPQLHVAARTSSFSVKGKDAADPGNCEDAPRGVHPEGSVRKSGDQVRITVQLIRAADSYRVWSETYDRKLDDIFAIQDEIAGKVVEQLKVTLFGPAPRVRTTDPGPMHCSCRRRRSRGSTRPRRSRSPMRCTSKRSQSIPATPRRGTTLLRTRSAKLRSACC